MQSLRTLLTGIVDYAGLFPPATLDMPTTVRNYHAYRLRPDAWMLGRLVVPATRLAAFEDAARGLLPTEPDDEPWRISALVGEDLDADIDAIFAFNARHEAEPGTGAVVADTIELRCADAAAVDAAMAVIPEQLDPFLELDLRGDVRGAITAIAGTGGRAKIRCGGVTPELIPSIADVAGFIAACAHAGIAFKATAGLHHPVRDEHPLTYDEDPPRAVMHGFLNVFLAAAIARAAGAPRETIERVLAETDAAAFTFSETGAAWRDVAVDTAQLAAVRESTAISFGSCSFVEPVDDLTALGLL